MGDKVYTDSQVREMWKRDYAEQIGVAQAKCMEAIVRSGGKLYVSFSGGKDSAVVLYIMAQMWSVMNGNKKPLYVCFSDTTNEFVCVKKYIQEYIEYIQNKFDIVIEFITVKGEKTYIDIVDQIGLPFISKKIARMIKDCKTTFKRLGLRYADIESLLPKHLTKNHYDEILVSANKLRELGFNDVVVLYLTKLNSKNEIGQRYLPLCYRPIIDEDSIIFSDKCCKHLKKDPMKKIANKLGGYLPVTGEMACDSKDRFDSYLRTGCNMFDGDSPKSKPIGPMTEQTVLRYIKDEKIPILPVYGDIVEQDQIPGQMCLDCVSNDLKTTGENRTGCKLCGFGLVFDPDRFVRLYELEPNTVKFAFTSKENGGLGYRQVCLFLNEHCGMNIGIPNVEEGYYPKRAEKVG